MTVSILAPLLLALLVISGCSERRQEEKLPTLSFNVDRSLLDEAIIDRELGVSFSPPRAWVRLSDTLLSAAAKAVIPDTGSVDGWDAHGISLRYAWLENESASLVTVSRVTGFDESERSRTLEAYRAFFEGTRPDAEVQTAVFLARTFKVHQLLVTTQESVAFKMVFTQSGVRHGVQFDFVVPTGAYPSTVRIIESVAGSLNPI